jgi:hypothetical protein
MKIPRKLSVVKFDFENLPKKYRPTYPFKKGQSYLFLGEITNMPGHCALADKFGHIHFGYHTDNFVELTEDEV